MTRKGDSLEGKRSDLQGLHVIFQRVQNSQDIVDGKGLKTVWRSCLLSREYSLTSFRAGLVGVVDRVHLADFRDRFFQ
jgi:hypothetical protein